MALGFGWLFSFEYVQIINFHCVFYGQSNVQLEAVPTVKLQTLALNFVINDH